MRKGISPIIASVLLLAVTLSAASIFSGWGPGLISSVTDEAENQTQKTIDCNQASVEIISAKYYTDGETSIVLRNRGTADLDELQASAWQDDLPMDETTTSLARGNFTTVNVSTSSKPDTVKAFSKDCSSVKDEHEEIS